MKLTWGWEDPADPENYSIRFGAFAYHVFHLSEEKYRAKLTNYVKQTPQRLLFLTAYKRDISKCDRYKHQYNSILEMHERIVKEKSENLNFEYISLYNLTAFAANETKDGTHFSKKINNQRTELIVKSICPNLE